MSGHSKWANIQHRKNAQDKKKGKVFSRLIRELAVAAREGGGDPDSNPKLRLAMDRAISENMTKDTMERAIARAVGGAEGANVEEISYEGYGPSGVAVLVKCLSDNRNRTVSEVRHAFTKSGGNLGSSGSVSYLFADKGYLIFEPGTDEDKVMEIAIEAGADDVMVNEDKSIEVITSPDAYQAVKDAMIKAHLTPAQADVTKLPSTKTELDESASEKVMRLVDMLEDLDDVQEVYTNAAL